MLGVDKTHGTSIVYKDLTETLIFTSDCTNQLNVHVIFSFYFMFPTSAKSCHSVRLTTPAHGFGSVATSLPPSDLTSTKLSIDWISLLLLTAELTIVTLGGSLFHKVTVLANKAFVPVPVFINTFGFSSTAFAQSISHNDKLKNVLSIQWWTVLSSTFAWVTIVNLI